MKTSTTTISQRINLGFLILILLSACAGILNIYQMRTAATGARFLSEAVAPQAGVADDLNEALAGAQLAARTFSLTGDPAQLDIAQKHLAEVVTALDAARKLSDDHPELVALRDGVKAADEDLKNYQKALAATKDNLAELATIRQQLDTAGATFARETTAYMDSENKSFSAEIAAGLAKEKLEERRHKIDLGNAILESGNTVRISAFKAQALRDSSLVEKALPLFNKIERDRDSLLKITTQAASRQQLESIKQSADAYHAGIDALVRNYAQNQQITAVRTKAAAEFDAVVGDVLKRSIARTLEFSTATAADLTSASVKTIIVLALSIAIGIAASLLIVRSINRALTLTSQSLSQGSMQVASASGQVSAASQSLAEGSSEQAASLEEISSSLEELSSTTKNNATAAGSAKASANDARTSAEDGASEMQKMQAAMEAIRQSSSDIAKILKTIDEIAFQTNILALNAAVEAARAGEAGMGFAVVADEVRNLAQRCAVAAKETAEKISDATTRSEQGVDLSNRVAASLTQILEKARQVDSLVAEVASASGEQSRGIEQINGAIGQLDKVTQSNAASAEETASASEELNAQSEELRQSALQLAALVGLSEQDAGASTHAHAAKKAPKAPVRAHSPSQIKSHAQAPAPAPASAAKDDLSFS